MNQSGAITFWSVDAFLTLSSYGVLKQLTPELISRLSAFVDSYILFDHVYVPQRYSKQHDYLGGSDVFNFIPSEDLIHSDDLIKGITFDLDSALLVLPKITKDEAYWLGQHNPSITPDVYKELAPNTQDNIMSLMRIWLSSAMNEISEKYNASVLIPNSLHEIDKLQNKGNNNIDYLNKVYNQFSRQWSDKLISASKNVKDPYFDTIKSYPPFLAALLDRANSCGELGSTLKEMRNEYEELRIIRAKMTSEIEKADSIGEKSDIIQSWDASWETLLKSEFKRTGFSTKVVSASEIVKVISNALDYTKIIEFIAQKGLEFSGESQQHKRFRIFCTIKEDTDKIYFSSDNLYEKFGIEGLTKG